MILLGHGSAGRLSHDLIARHFLPRLGNPALNALLDSAVLGDLAFTSASYVVTPRFFLSAAFILEEGLALSELDRLVDSMAAAAREAGVQVVTGDTKVVPRGAADGAFITTSGVGRIDGSFRPAPRKVIPGDAVLVSGTVADHGTAVLACREGIHLRGDLQSDVAPLAGSGRRPARFWP